MTEKYTLIVRYDRYWCVPSLAECVAGFVVVDDEGNLIIPAVLLDPSALRTALQTLRDTHPSQRYTVLFQGGNHVLSYQERRGLERMLKTYPPSSGTESQ